MAEITPNNEEIATSANSSQEQLSQKNPPSKNKVIKITGITVIIVLISMGVYFGVKYLLSNTNQNNSTSLQSQPKVSPDVIESQNSHFLVYSTERKSANNIVGDKEKILYNLDTKQKVPFNLGSSDEENLPTEVKNAIFSSSTQENEILFLSDINNFIIISRYNQRSKQASEIVKIPKSQVLGITDWRDFSFSPDKTKILYATFGMGTPANIYLIDLSKQQSKQVTNSDGDTSPKWLNKNKIIFQRRDDSGNDSVWTIDALSGKEELLLGVKEGIDSNTAFRYAFTQDGNKLIFPSNLNKQGQDISILNIPSKQITKLFSIPYQDFTSAQMTKDGKYLVWGSLISGEYGSRSIFSYDLVKNEQNTICKSSPDTMCGDFYLEE